LRQRALALAASRNEGVVQSLHGRKLERAPTVALGFCAAGGSLLSRAAAGLCRRQPVHSPGGVRLQAAPRKKLPERSVDVICNKCKTRLFKYKKGGNGSLVKCYIERIVQDFRLDEDKEEGILKCPSCSTEFARHALVHGRPAFKMIGGEKAPFSVSVDAFCLSMLGR